MKLKRVDIINKELLNTSISSQHVGRYYITKEVFDDRVKDSMTIYINPDKIICARYWSPLYAPDELIVDNSYNDAFVVVETVEGRVFLVVLNDYTNWLEESMY